MSTNEHAEHAAKFSAGSAALAFMVAGRARFTLVSKKTGERFTYQITRGDGEKAPLFVALLSGPDNTTDYRFLGTIFENTATGRTTGGMAVAGPMVRSFVHGKKSKIGKDAPSAKAFAWAWPILASGRIPETAEVWHEGRCGRCGRALTVPESIASGIGPVCEEKEAA